MSEAIMFWIEFLKDKRFSVRFKICNIIMGDRLREMVAFSRMNAKEIIESEKLYKGIPEAHVKLSIMRAKHICNYLDDIVR